MFSYIQKKLKNIVHYNMILKYIKHLVKEKYESNTQIIIIIIIIIIIEWYIDRDKNMLNNFWNFLFCKENKLSLTNFRKKIIHYITITK